MKLTVNIPKSQIDNYQVMGLTGRRLNLESDKSKHFLLLGGQHTSIERMFSIAQFINDFGKVTLIDLPGFGGMPSFRKIGKPIELESYADFLFEYIKQYHDKQKIVIFATSFSAMVATLMLQRHPEAETYIDEVVMFVGLNSGNNFKIKGIQLLAIKLLVNTTSNPVGAKLFAIIFANKYTLPHVLKLFSFFKAKMKSKDKKAVMANIAMEFNLWRSNDRESHSKSTMIMLKEDLTEGRKINLKAHNIIARHDQYFDNDSVNAGFKKIYRMYTTSFIALEVHAPSLLASKADVAKLMSDKTIAILSK